MPDQPPNRIAKIRVERGLTISELARLVGVGRTSIIKVERGERRLSQEWMEKLSRALNVSPLQLLYPDKVPERLRVVWAPLLSEDQIMDAMKSENGFGKIGMPSTSFPILYRCETLFCVNMSGLLDPAFQNGPSTVFVDYADRKLVPETGYVGFIGPFGPDLFRYAEQWGKPALLPRSGSPRSPHDVLLVGRVVEIRHRYAPVLGLAGEPVSEASWLRKNRSSP